MKKNMGTGDRIIRLLIATLIAIFYFNGTHADYHRPGDTPDKINYDLLKNRAQLIFHTAWEIANREEPIAVDVPPEGTNIENTN